MQAEHEEALLAAAGDGELWDLRVTQVPNAARIGRYVASAIEARAGGEVLPFVTTLVGSGEVVGSSRMFRLSREHRRCEIGYTWIAQRHQRSVVNPEAKYLMLRYAFEHAGLIRVQFMTDALNTRSRGALTKLGAREEGLLRNERIMPDGRFRDSVVFSIIASEWSAVRRKLETRLAGHGVEAAFSIEESQP